MAVTLDTGAGAPLVIPAHGSLRWEDEHAWQPVLQSLDYTLSGAVVIEEWTRESGRPMTLSGRPSYATLSWGDIKDLIGRLNAPGVVATVTLDDARSFSCTARRDGGEPCVVFERSADAIDETDDTLHLLLEVRLLILEGPL